MMIIGCDYHSKFQQIAFFDPSTGEIGRMRLDHASGEAERFYTELRAPARIGVEATGAATRFILPKHLQVRSSPTSETFLEKSGDAFVAVSRFGQA